MNPGDLIITWNNSYLDLVRKIGGAPGPLARIGGLMHLAMFEAVNLLTYSERRYYTSIPTIQPPTGPADAGATAAAAARYVLLDSVPTYVKMDFAAQEASPAFLKSSTNHFQTSPEAAALLADNKLNYMLPPVPSTGDPALDTAADALGKQIAQTILAANPIGNGADPTITPPLDPTISGEWRATGSGAAATPQWGKLKLVLVAKSPQDYYPKKAIPPGQQSYSALLASSLYADDLQEVREKGAATGSTRSDTETETAFFWANDLNGTSKPPGQLYTITQIVARQEGILKNQKDADGLLETARLFAMVGTAMFNASIVAWQAKYFWPATGPYVRLWRPETAIGNAATSPDSTWQPLSTDENEKHFSPSFPAYVSGHSTFGAAHAAAMKDFFGDDNISFVATTEDPHAKGVTRSFTSFTQAAKQNGESRIFLGVHYRFDAEGGYEIGTAVGEDTAKKFAVALVAAN